ncbi:MAG TPA: TfoX/Sxy family DNA transformation protein [Candidatus Cryosericum sp.]|nr:TfoX/Sxy family DNA transformation protein [Candidatus Cryosericum sp.]
MGELSALPNNGEVLEKQLNDASIATFAQLKELGSEETWLGIKTIDASACIHRLYTLEGASGASARWTCPLRGKRT